MRRRAGLVQSCRRTAYPARRQSCFRHIAQRQLGKFPATLQQAARRQMVDGGSGDDLRTSVQHGAIRGCCGPALERFDQPIHVGRQIAAPATGLLNQQQRESGAHQADSSESAGDQVRDLSLYVVDARGAVPPQSENSEPGQDQPHRDVSGFHRSVAHDNYCTDFHGISVGLARISRATMKGRFQ